MGRRQLRVGRRRLRGRRARWRRSSRCASACPRCAPSSSSTRRATTADAISLDEVRERGRGRDARRARARAPPPSTPDDPFTFIYTSGTTGPPKGCVLTHGNYRAVLDMLESSAAPSQDDEVTYLFLPLAHAFALLIQLVDFDLGTTHRLLRRRHARRSSPELQRGQADLPARRPAHLREDLHARARLAAARGPGEDAGRRQARRAGPRPAGPRRGGPARAAARPSRRPRSSCSRTCARSSAGACARRSPARRRSPRRSSSSSTAAACRCSRATA